MEKGPRWSKSRKRNAEGRSPEKGTLMEQVPKKERCRNKCGKGSWSEFEKELAGILLCVCGPTCRS